MQKEMEDFQVQFHLGGWISLAWGLLPIGISANCYWVEGDWATVRADLKAGNERTKVKSMIRTSVMLHIYLNEFYTKNSCNDKYNGLYMWLILMNKYAKKNYVYFLE